MKASQLLEKIKIYSGNKTEKNVQFKNIQVLKIHTLPNVFHLSSGTTNEIQKYKKYKVVHQMFFCVFFFA